MVNLDDCWRHCLLKEDSYASCDLLWEDFDKPNIRRFLIRFAKMQAESNKGTKLLLWINIFLKVYMRKLVIPDKGCRA